MHREPTAFPFPKTTVNKLLWVCNGLLSLTPNQMLSQGSDVGPEAEHTGVA